MKAVRKFVKNYYIRHIVACFLVGYMLLGIPVQIAQANPTPADTALPTGFDPVVGDAVIDTSILNQLHINSIENGTVINWDTFDTGSLATTQFHQADSSHWVMNNVLATDNMASGIAGNLIANGNIIISNPHGIVVAPTAFIQARTAVFSSLRIDEDMFEEGVFKQFAEDYANPAIDAELGFFSEAGDTGYISIEKDAINQAEIEVDDNVILLAKKIVNMGTITTGTGGCVVMVAGDSLILGEPGSKVIVEMTSATGDLDGVGSVINAGIIESPQGKVVLAAGDIFSIPIHPQLQVAEEGEDPVVADQPVRVELGTGTVTQNGTINADGAAGEVVLTAGDEVVLGESSTTSSVDGKVIAYAYDFGDKAATTYFNASATVQVGTGLADISGNHVLFSGSVDVLPGGTIQVDPVTLTIADIIPTEGPALDTFYEEWIEDYSGDGVHLDLAADELITVEYMADGEILGGTGNIELRNVFDTGRIYFNRSDEGESNPVGPRTAIRTLGGGDIYMLAGSGGITTGDLTVGVASGNVTGDPGQILLLSNNGGDIETGAMFVRSGNNEIISAISSGDLIINGGLEAEGQEVSDAADKTISTKICLVADGFVEVNGDIVLYAHGKNNTRADLHIDAVGNITVDGKIDVEANTSGSPVNSDGTLFAETLVRVHSVAQDEGDQEAIDIADGVDSRAKIKGANFIASSSGDAGDNVDVDDGNTEDDAIYDQVTGELIDGKHILIEIENNFDISNCKDCPRPPGLPPVPVVFWLADDAFTTGWRSGNITGFDPEELDVLLNDNGIKFDASIVLPEGQTVWETEKGGTLVLFPFTDPDTQQTFWGFKYTPPTDQDFVWDGVEDFAYFTDTFEYQATKEINGETVLSRNTATVTIAVTNFLPTAAPDSDTIPMDDTSVFGLAVGGLITDSDGSPGDLELALSDPVFGDSELSGPTAPADATYTPFEGFVGGDDFDYTVTDSTVIYPGDVTPESSTATLTVTVENELPSGEVVLEDAHMDDIGQTLGVVSGDFTDADDPFAIVSIEKATDDDNHGFGGTVAYNGSDDPYITGDTYNYNADSELPGYVGEDNFDVQLWDGQYDYVKAIDLDDRQQYIDDGYVPFGGAESLIVRKPVYGTGTIDLEVTNILPSGAVVLEDAHMNAIGQTLGTVSGEFTDVDDEFFALNNIEKATNDDNKTFGGTLVYKGAQTYDYTADPLLPGYVGEDDFDVQLWDGQKTYAFKEVGGEWVIDYENTVNVYGPGTIDLTVTNTVPSGAVVLEDAHMNASGETLSVASGDFTDADDPFAIVSIEKATDDDNKTFGGALAYNGSDDPYVSGDTYDYTADGALPGYVGEDNFDVQLSDGQINYTFIEVDGEWFVDTTTPVFGAGTIDLTVTNTLPTASGDLGQTTSGTILTVPQELPPTGSTIPVFVDDDDAPLDNLSIVQNITYFGSSGGKLVFDGTEWIYTPASGHTGPEEFIVKVSDGQNNYEFVKSEVWIAIPTPEYGTGTVSVTVGEPTLLPAAPLPELEYPDIQGCPVLMQAAASELGVTSENIQITIGQALVLNPNLQPCEACGNLLRAAVVLRDDEGARLAALGQVVQDYFTGPISTENMDSFLQLVADMKEDPTNVAYADAGDWDDSLQDYIEILTELGFEAEQMLDIITKYITTITEGDNEALIAYVEFRLAQLTAGL